jgi:hypothetical protein
MRPTLRFRVACLCQTRCLDQRSRYPAPPLHYQPLPIVKRTIHRVSWRFEETKHYVNRACACVDPETPENDAPAAVAAGYPRVIVVLVLCRLLEGLEPPMPCTGLCGTNLDMNRGALTLCTCIGSRNPSSAKLICRILQVWPSHRRRPRRP